MDAIGTQRAAHDDMVFDMASDAPADMRPHDTDSRAKASTAIRYLDSLGFMIVQQPFGWMTGAGQEDDYPLTHARVWG